MSSFILQDRDTSERCQDEKKTNCAENFLINPKASSIAYNSVSAPKQEKTSEKQKKDEKNFKSSVSTSSTLKNITSVFPQFINITLRPSKFPLPTTSFLLVYLHRISHNSNDKKEL